MKARGLVHETWKKFVGDIHIHQLGSIAYVVLDSRLFDIEGHQGAIRSDVPLYQSQSLEDLAVHIMVPACTPSIVDSPQHSNAAATGNAEQSTPRAAMDWRSVQPPSRRNPIGYVR